MPVSIPAVQARPERGGPRRLAAVRLPRVQPDRAAAGRPRRRRQNDHPALVLHDPGQPASPKKLVHAIEPFNLDHLPGGKTIYSQRDTLASGLQGGPRRLEADRDGVLAGQHHPLHLARRCRHGRSGAAARASTSSRRAISCSGSRRSGRPRRCRRIAPPSERLYRIKDRAFDFVRDGAARRPARSPSSTCSAQMVGWFDGRGADHRQPARRRRRRKTPGDPHYGPSEQKHRAIGDGEVVLLDLWGKLPAAGRGVRRHHLGRVYGAAGARTDTSRRSTPRATAATRRSRWCKERGRGAGREIRGFEVDRACRAVLDARRLRRAVHPPHRPQPRAPRSTATACTWTTTRRTTSAG